MPKPFDELRERLLRAGIAPRYVRRYLSELADHLADISAERNARAAAGRMQNLRRSPGLAGWMISSRRWLSSGSSNPGASGRRGRHTAWPRPSFWLGHTSLPVSFCGLGGRSLCRE
jgi:hypothetical protein